MSDLSLRLRDALDRSAAGASTVALTAAVERLSDRYRSVRPAGAPILAGPAEVLAYAVYRMPATYAAVRLALRQGVRAGLGPIGSVADLGGGTGAAVWAAAEALPDLRAATVLEQVAAARDLGRTIAAEDLGETSWRDWRVGEPVPSADLVSAAYVLSELTEEQQARLVADAMAAAGAAVLVVEPGTPDGHRRVLAARELLLAAGWQVLAPCPHAFACPLADGDWCHFAARVNRSALHRRVKSAELSHEDEKFSYVLAVRRSTRQDAGDGARDVRSIVPVGRVVRHPLKRKGLVELQLCRPDGTAGREVVSKRHGAAYKVARDVAWGDTWPPAD
ncbi:small ribosomal subunit Rsm22 family protein [Luteipulveratus sp. YIM 133132]|uniref:small ribosomal subunit Rsm22 family protein n=1 Tax=Luteipulveratus flavus TaxID=3031728 RepID=UPI0023B0959D|nr:small ribosomal subunit Rsm22 family protein [Luteipulveratus sp. YIM 133132]MDE9365625.1 small ribosomal subunit Rsm22 family protein [Luteipulveratus sp. YIM 133132]